ncbi:hypothetical protein [Mesorhizobium sp. Mes31]|uniref:hypothetical protein n=1 Tax=Mesorhizobium sp. Mes31 TaxID=2926017 RepID=UPI002117A620|nr:hypothetical protein [Mesorhizobium sp. Mes31]
MAFWVRVSHMLYRSDSSGTSKEIWATTSLVLFTIILLLAVVSGNGSSPHEHWQTLWMW